MNYAPNTDMPADQIRDALWEAGISQSDIARALKVTPAAVNRTITGSSVSHRVRLAIAAAANLPVNDIWPSAYDSSGRLINPELRRSDSGSTRRRRGYSSPKTDHGWFERYQALLKGRV